MRMSLEAGASFPGVFVAGLLTFGKHSERWPAEPPDIQNTVHTQGLLNRSASGAFSGGADTSTR